MRPDPINKYVPASGAAVKSDAPKLKLSINSFDPLFQVVPCRVSWSEVMGVSDVIPQKAKVGWLKVGTVYWFPATVML
jgi:hypothetical protein